MQIGRLPQEFVAIILLLIFTYQDFDKDARISGLQGLRVKSLDSAYNGEQCMFKQIYNHILLWETHQSWRLFLFQPIATPEGVPMARILCWVRKPYSIHES